MIVDPLPLAVRYLEKSGDDLTHDEIEILLFALYMESVKNGGLMASAVKQIAIERAADAKCFLPGVKL
jgi:hypothetical protein